MPGISFAEDEMNKRTDVLFGIPDWTEIREHGKTCVDMHFHTNCSDSYTDYGALMQLASRRGTGVAITDHNLVSNAIREDVPDDVLVIPGVEVSTSDGPHILVYFYERSDLKDFYESYLEPRLQSCPWLALKNCDTADLLDRLKDENCAISAAHPMGYLGSNKGVEVCIRKGYLDKSIVSGLDAYEVICSGMTHLNNISAIKSALEHGLNFTGGTDGHLLSEVGRVVTISESNTIEGFLNDLKSGKNSVVGLEKNLIKKGEMAAASLSKFLRHAPSAGAVQAHQLGKGIKRSIDTKTRK